MLKLFTFCLFCVALAATNVKAAIVEFIGPCSKIPIGGPVFFTSVNPGETVESLTLQAAEKRNIEVRTKSLREERMLEFLSLELNPKEPIQYHGFQNVGIGWCATVNGQELKSSAQHIAIDPTDSTPIRITWTHSYSVMINNKWNRTSTCVPTHTDKVLSQHFCPDQAN